MRNFLTASIFFLATAIFAAPAQPPAKIRTIANAPNLAADPLRQIISPKFYNRLAISPIEGWIIVRARLADTRLIAAKVIQSELNGAYDSLALELANKTKLSQRHRDETHLVAGDFTTGTYITQYPVLLHLLIYKVVDGKMALSFVHFDNPGGNQNTYYGSPWIAVQKDGKWTKVFPK